MTETGIQRNGRQRSDGHFSDDQPGGGHPRGDQVGGGQVGGDQSGSGQVGGGQAGGGQAGGDQSSADQSGGGGPAENGWFETPAIPASAGALIFDRKGRLLILKPTYKSGWTIPGGVMEADGETPWEACRREVREECGLEVASGRLAAVDFRRPRPGKPGGMRFLFDCGALADAALSAVVLQSAEVSQYRLASMPTALSLLRGPIRRRVRAACRAKSAVYLEEGRLVRSAR